MSIVAWRILWITLVSRISPNTSCRFFLNEVEWKILYSIYNKNKPLPKHPPNISQCTKWISMLGGFLARKNDNKPGIIYIWRGLKKFTNILERVAIAKDIYG